MQMRLVRLSIAGFLAVLGTGLPLYSQVVSGTIVGTVHDPSGA